MLQYTKLHYPPLLKKKENKNSGASEGNQVKQEWS